MDRLPTLPRPRDLAAMAALVMPLLLAQGAAGQTLPGAEPVKKTPVPLPVIGAIAEGKPALDVRKPAIRRHATRHHVHVARRAHRFVDLDRPPLAGVLLATPVPAPVRPPRPMVPTPAYFVDSIPAAFTEPPPPLVCHHAWRDAALPDPHLRREVPVACRADID